MSSIQRALISVSDKSGLTDFAQALSDQGVEILSTGGTAKLLKAHGISVTEVSDYTHFPEIMADTILLLLIYWLLIYIRLNKLLRSRIVI